MAALVNALDNITPLQLGENAHCERGWSNSIQERIVQFYFQITRTTADRIDDLQRILKTLMLDIKYKLTYNLTEYDSQEAKLLLATLYKIVGQTRDIIDGKGEYALSYMMILAWYSFSPALGTYALYNFVTPLSSEKSTATATATQVEGVSANSHPYGSWKDIKYFCNYCKEQGLSAEHPLMEYAYKLINDQVRVDVEQDQSESLASKWVPREKSKKFGWIFNELAIRYFPEYLLTANTLERHTSSVKKCKTQYRKIVSNVNKKLGTTQIFQTGKEWASIDINKITSITLYKQKKALLNVKLDGKTQRSELEDRIKCGEHLREHLTKAAHGELEIKGKRIGMADFTKEALRLIKLRGYSRPQDKPDNYEASAEIQAQIDLLNAQWVNNSTQTKALEMVVPMCDCSGSMAGDPMHVAIALSIRAAEKSKLGKRVLAFSAMPTWTDLSPYDNFVDMVSVLMHEGRGLNTNFFLALKMMLDAIEEKKLTPEDVDGLILAIFSDMQIDGSTGHENLGLDMYSSIVQKFNDLGMRMWGRPFAAPHLLFWNLRSTDGFPTLSSVQNASMMSGFSPTLLNLFSEKGMSAFESCTPWSLLLQSLENERYMRLGAKLYEEMGF
jgi:hypothetical protein